MYLFIQVSTILRRVSALTEKAIDKEIVFVLLNDSRNKILHYLSKKGDFSQSNEIASATGLSMSNVSFHCRKLADRGMITSTVESGKAVHLITVKGTTVVQEVDKCQQRKSGATGTRKQHSDQRSEEIEQK